MLACLSVFVFALQNYYFFCIYASARTLFFTFSYTLAVTLFDCRQEQF